MTFRWLITVLRMSSLFVSMLLFGCDDNAEFAPVVESRWLALNQHQSTHIVQAGETLYAVAFRYDKDYRQLAVYNQLRPPYALRTGQVLQLHYPQHPSNHPMLSRASSSLPASSSSMIQVSHLSIHRDSPSAQVSNTTIYSRLTPSSAWSWPASGRVVSNYIPGRGKKGIDIAGKRGDGIFASAPGVVAYSGSGITGYGNLIIIKHSNQYLTAYGYNAKNFVREGQRINQGQRIADMGVIDRQFYGVHFEIRRAGQPVNPLTYLKRR